MIIHAIPLVTNEGNIRCLGWQRETRIEPLTEISTAMRGVSSGSYQWRVGWRKRRSRSFVETKQTADAG